ncbi:hypothetical protein Ctob_009176 [Chrysochromulina tobinii]|uniref:Uncharacterized protein n=1 Tax=Chrysochromulina tobinii TaxID=1460289 RepID=A0A0M0JJC6_9EUKA|nr:hypothetical protein Ctob_009176 [Chrysochromulina tobinii]|eukprot:KOO26696.1 hypothetical protein Ctob_009176 [Chrysochromulina sp. CCMP291]
MSCRSDAIRMASADWRFWREKLASVWSRVMPESMIPFSMPILASFLANSTSNLFWSKLQFLSTDVTGRREATSMAAGTWSPPSDKLSSVTLSSRSCCTGMPGMPQTTPEPAQATAAIVSLNGGSPSPAMQLWRASLAAPCSNEGRRQLRIPHCRSAARTAATSTT